MSHCGIVILAAGASTRMGVAKQSLQFEGTTLLDRAVRTALASVCRPIVVVLGSGADGLRSTLSALPVSVVENDRWHTGIGSSIRCGMAAISCQAIDAAMIFLCDQPLVRFDHLNQLVETHFATGKKITAASYAGAIGTPAVFAASLFDQLLNLPDSQGGKGIMNRHMDDLITVELPAAEVDVDTPDDFQNLAKRK